MVCCDREAGCFGFRWYHAECLGGDLPNDLDTEEFVCVFCRTEESKAETLSLSATA